MKISVCGKGGSGKSTVVSLLAERLAAAGKEVLKDMMLSNFTHQFFEGQWKLEENQIAILDMEAGIEHFGRGLDDEVDLILMVCDPSYESVQLAAKIRELGEKLQKPVYYVLNKTDETSREVLTQAIQNSQRILAVLPAEPELTAAALLGRKLVWESSVMDRAAEKICGMQA